KSLSDKLRRLAPALKRSGIAVDFRRVGGTSSKRLILIEGVSIENCASPQSPASPGDEFRDEGDGSDACDAENPTLAPQVPSMGDDGDDASPSYEEDYL